MTKISKTRKFRSTRAMRSYELDMQSPLEFEVNVRRRNLKRSNHYTEVVKKIIDGITHYLLYKSKKPAYHRFYPLTRRAGL